MNKILKLEISLAVQDEKNQQLKNKILYKAEAEKVVYVESGKGFAAKRAAIVDGIR